MFVNIDVLHVKRQHLYRPLKFVGNLEGILEGIWKGTSHSGTRRKHSLGVRQIPFAGRNSHYCIEVHGS